MNASLMKTDLLIVAYPICCELKAGVDAMCKGWNLAGWAFNLPDWLAWNYYLETRSPAGFRLDVDFAAVLLDDLIGYKQAQSGSLVAFG